MKNSIFLTVLLGLLFAAGAPWSMSTAVAQDPGDTLWTRAYGGNSDDKGMAVQQTTDGGSITVGYTSSFGAGGSDFYLIKTDGNGGTLWTRTYGGTAGDYGQSVQQTADGGYIVTGYTLSFGAGSNDVWLIKTDADGDTLWTHTYGGSARENGRFVQQTSDGGYIVVGSTQSPGDWDIYVVKTDPSGNSLWTHTYGGSGNDFGRCIRQTSDGGYVLSGYTNSFGAGGNDFYLLKTDASGDTLWTRTYGGTGAEWGYEVRQTSDGGYVFTGYTNSFGAGGDDVWLLKIDPKGDTLWTRTYGGTGGDLGFSVQQTADGGYVIAGETAYGPGGNCVYLVKTDANGDTLWTRWYGGTDSDQARSVSQTADGAYIVTGYTSSFGASGFNVYLLKIAGEPPQVEFECETPCEWFCRGKNFPFKITVTNNTGGDVSGTLAFEGYSGYDCDSNNVMVTRPRTKTYPPGVTEQYYHFKVPNTVEPGQYSASVSGTLGDFDLFCCMNTDIVQCGPWRGGDNTEWELVEVDRPEVALPTVTELYQNYPNPFNATTNISFNLAEAGNVSLKVYDITGRLMVTLVDGHKDAGEHVVAWDASNVSSGVYFYKLTTADYTATKSMNLLK